MSRRLISIATALMLTIAPTALVAGGATADGDRVPSLSIFGQTSLPVLEVPPALPLMSPELALETYQQRAQHQLADLAEYSDETVIKAELPSSSQKGEYWLKRSYSASGSVAFKAMRFVGDGFVKSNVIARLLQSEVDHAQKGEGRDVAIIERNYKFKYKGVEDLNGERVYAYEVKARKKRPELFKGRILISAQSGRLRRAWGRLSKSPSLFIKRIDFTQDYTEVGEFTLPARIQSIAATRIVGTVVADIQHSGYQARSAREVKSAQMTPLPTSAGSN